MSVPSPKDADDTPIFDFVLLLLKRWKTVGLFCLLGTAAGVVYGLLAPPWYQARLRVVPALKSQDAAAMSLASKLPIGLDSISTDVQRIQTVLHSDSVTDDVIAKFDLQRAYGATVLEQARAAVWEHCATSVDRKSNVVTLTCEDKDPARAKDMSAYFGEVGNRVFRRISATSTGEERKFLETQVTKARQEVDDASSKLRDFQEKHKIIDLPEQTKAVISAMASIQADLLSKQLELSYLRSFSAQTESNVMQLQQQIGILQNKLGQLETARATTPGPPTTTPAKPPGDSFFPGAMNVPDLRFELEQLFREQKIKETVFFLMTQRYELARIDEARDTSTFQILDHPTLPGQKSRPKRRMVALTGLLIGFGFACAWVLIPHWWRRRMKQREAMPADA